MIHIENQRRKPRLPTSRIQTMVQAILDALDLSHAHVSITLTNDAAIHELNRTWRNKDKPTDVLSFSQIEGEVFTQHGPIMLGDIVISYDTAAKQALQIGHSLDAEMCRLMVHGMLHLLGHDHVHGGRQAAKMKKEEARILRKLKRNK